MKTSKAHHVLKAAKADRRSKREGRRGPDRDRRWQATPLTVGPIDPAILLRLTNAFGSVDLGGPWDEVASILRTASQARPLTHSLPHAAPITCGCRRALDGLRDPCLGGLAPCTLCVLLARWDVVDAHVLGRALDNLQARVSDEPPLVERAVFGRVGRHRDPCAGTRGRR